MSEVEFTNDGTSGHWWLMDNMEVVMHSSPDAPLVPEPASIAIWGLGGLALAFGAWRRKSRKRTQA